MPDDQHKSFAVALIRARIDAGIPTQAAFARAAGISAVEACRYETGKRLPTLLSFASLTRRAGIDPIPLLASLDEPAGTQEEPCPKP